MSNTLLHVVSNFEPLFSGASFQSKRVIAELEKKGWDNLILSFDDQKVNNLDKAKVFRVRNKKTSFIFALFSIITSGCDSLMIHGGLKRLILLALFIRKPINFKITTSHEILALRKPVVKWFLSQRNVRIFNITSEEIDYEEEFFVSNVPVRLNFQSDTSSVFTFYVVGAVCERKSSMDILMWFYEKYSNNNGVRLCFIGPYDNTFSEWDKKYIDKFFEKASLLHNVYILGRQDFGLYDFKSNCGLIHMSSVEGSPNSVLEFLYSGKPVFVNPLLKKNFHNSLVRYINFCNLDKVTIPSESSSMNSLEYTCDDIIKHYINNIK